MAVAINREEEFTRDWDWYAVDHDGMLGHFTSAGLRQLPRSIRQDREAIESVKRHFFENAPVICNWSIREDVSVDIGGWGRGGRERYVRDASLMASKGLYSYDTDLIYSANARYFLVARPSAILLVRDLPPAIGAIVCRTRAPLTYRTCPYIAESVTAEW